MLHGNIARQTLAAAAIRTAFEMHVSTCNKAVHGIACEAAAYQAMLTSASKLHHMPANTV
jgi:hypothetical protein